MDRNRREFIQNTLSGAATGLIFGLPKGALAEEHGKKDLNQKGIEEVSPVEDLMREHGALNRILLIYDEVIRRLREKEEIQPELIRSSATIVHDFIENYHEKLEEEFVFPTLKKAGRLTDTVDALLAQHRAGRGLTERIMGLSTPAHFKTAGDVSSLETALRLFVRMYRPHEAREDTIVFPEFKKLVTPRNYDALGDQFEEREHKLFGKEGFEGVVAKIAVIEKRLRIYDLAQFTP